tara:strand:+ start:194 stop:607 length:414 start_codon:yes stop_codon:yes gene_type:complete
MTDIRWIQRFNNYKKALSQLEAAVLLMEERDLSLLEKQGAIQAFEFTHELAWKTMKDFLNERGNTEIYGSKDSARQAFKYGLISDGDTWLQMVKSRNLTSHTYNEKISEDIIHLIKTAYFKAFKSFEEKMKSILEEE